MKFAEQKRRSGHALIAALGMVTFVVWTAFAAQDSTPPKVPSPEEMKAMAERQARAASPGEHHKFLQRLAGNWNVAIKVFAHGHGGTMESTGTATIKPVLGGRFLLEETKGTMMGMPYEMLALLGYDNFKNLYTFTAADNMNTQTIQGVGSRPPGANRITFYGKMDEPMLQVYGRTVKYVYRLLSDDKFAVDVIDLHAADDYKVVELTYTRK